MDSNVIPGLKLSRWSSVNVHIFGRVFTSCCSALCFSFCATHWIFLLVLVLILLRLLLLLPILSFLFLFLSFSSSFYSSSFSYFLFFISSSSSPPSPSPPPPPSSSSSSSPHSLNFYGDSLWMFIFLSGFRISLQCAEFLFLRNTLNISSSSSFPSSWTEVRLEPRPLLGLPFTGPDPATLVCNIKSPLSSDPLHWIQPPSAKSAY